MTNQQFRDSNEDFKVACERVGLEPTKRQASKWRMGKGKAYKNGRGA